MKDFYGIVNENGAKKKGRKFQEVAHNILQEREIGGSI